MEKKIDQLRVHKSEQRIQIRHNNPSYKAKRAKQRIETPQSMSSGISLSPVRDAYFEAAEKKYLIDSKRADVFNPKIMAGEYPVEDALKDLESMITNKGHQRVATTTEQTLNYKLKALRK
jgi:hypothetical protein